MGDDAWSVYQERLRLIEERKASMIRRAEALAVAEEEEAFQDYLKARENDLKAMGKKPRRKKPLVPTPLVQVMTSQANITAAPTFNQNGDGGQFIANNLYH